MTLGHFKFTNKCKISSSTLETSLRSLSPLQLALHFVYWISLIIPAVWKCKFGKIFTAASIANFAALGQVHFPSASNHLWIVSLWIPQTYPSSRIFPNECYSVHLFIFATYKATVSLAALWNLKLSAIMFGCGAECSGKIFCRSSKQLSPRVGGCNKLLQGSTFHCLRQMIYACPYL